MVRVSAFCFYQREHSVALHYTSSKKVPNKIYQYLILYSWQFYSKDKLPDFYMIKPLFIKIMKNNSTLFNNIFSRFTNLMRQFIFEMLLIKHIFTIVWAIFFKLRWIKWIKCGDVALLQDLFFKLINTIPKTCNLALHYCFVKLLCNLILDIVTIIIIITII